MRIVVYSPTWFPVRDGTSIQAERLARLLEEHNEVNRLSYAVDRNVQRIEAPVNNVEYARPSYRRDAKFPQLDGAAIAARIMKLRPDIIHIRGWYQFTAVDAILDAATESGSSVYLHPDGLHECHDRFVGQGDYSRTIKKAIPCATNFISNSAADDKIFRSVKIPRERTFKIPPIVPEIRCNKKWDRPSLLTVARFFPYKGHMQVWNSFKCTGPWSGVVLAGAADCAKSIPVVSSLVKQAAPLWLNPSDKDLERLYLDSSHFVLASSRESLGIATLEAVCAGCIAFARSIGGIPSYLPDDFLFDSDDELTYKLSQSVGEDTARALDAQLENLREYLAVDNVRKLYEELHRRR